MKAERPIVCYVTDRKSLRVDSSTPSVLKNIRDAVDAGADMIQIREKDLPVRELLELVRKAAKLTQQISDNSRVIVNDRLDVAITAGAAGVHLGGKSMPARDAVNWCRSGNAAPEFLVGVSTHNIEEALAAEQSGASYIFVGPIFETPSKAAFGPPQGVEQLAEICRAVRIPVIAIGGVNEENGQLCLRAGAAGVAAIRLFQESRDQEELREAIAQLRER